jgi:hypothetical protein
MLPLFAPQLIQKRLTNFVFPEDLQVQFAKVSIYLEALHQRQTGINIHEFLYDLFVEALDYQSPFAETEWELDLEPDAQLGFFSPTLRYPIVLIDYSALCADEARVNPIDLDASIQWKIVIDYQAIALFHLGISDIFCQYFPLTELLSLDKWREFYLLCCRRTLLPRFPNSSAQTATLLAESQELAHTTAKSLYLQISSIRHYLVKDFRYRLQQVSLPDPEAVANRAVMLLLRRIIFILYAQTQQILPANLLEDAYSFFNPYQEQAVWHNYQAIFHWLGYGGSRLKESLPLIPCGLFQTDPILDEQLFVGDELCRQLKELVKYPVSDGVLWCTLEALLESNRKRSPKYPCKQLLNLSTTWQKVQSAVKNYYQERSPQDAIHLLEKIRVIHYQCQSGMQLVTAFKCLLGVCDSLFPNCDLCQIAEYIVQNCLYGSDANPEAIALTHLNLWLTALPWTMPHPALEAHIAFPNQVVFPEDTYLIEL